MYFRWFAWIPLNFGGVLYWTRADLLGISLMFLMGGRPHGRRQTIFFHKKIASAKKTKPATKTSPSRIDTTEVCPFRLSAWQHAPRLSKFALPGPAPGIGGYNAAHSLC